MFTLGRVALYFWGEELYFSGKHAPLYHDYLSYDIEYDAVPAVETFENMGWV